MFAFDLRFKADYEAVSTFLGALFRNGQAVGDWPVVYADGAELCCRLAAPTEDALDPFHDGPWVVEARKSLGGTSARLVGRDVESPAICGCAAPSARILIAGKFDSEIPVRCGDCWGVVPLFRVPFLGDSDEHYPLHCWTTVRKSFDDIWYQGFAGEGYAYAQLSDPRSPLSRRGREICADLERKTGVPFYYFLMLYHGPDPERCPGCGRDWAWEDSAVSWIPHRCEPCRLVAQRGGKDEEIPDPEA